MTNQEIEIKLSHSRELIRTANRIKDQVNELLVRADLLSDVVEDIIEQANQIIIDVECSIKENQSELIRKAFNK